MTQAAHAMTGEEQLIERIERLAERVSLLENDLVEIKEILEQHAKDEELGSVNINRLLKGLQPSRAKTDLLGSEDLKNLPWKSYQTKEAAKENEAAWIFCDTKGAEALLAVLKTKEKAEIGNFEYARSGAEKQFISRKPLKTKA